MNIILEPEAEADLKSLEESHQKFVKERLQKLRDNPTGNSDSGLIKVDGGSVFKYVMKDKGRGGKDYRAVYDIVEKDVRIVAIFHRDKGYDKSTLSRRF